MRRLHHLVFIGLLLVASPLAAQTLPIPPVTGPQFPLPIMVAPFNTLISQINAVLVPVLGTTPSSGTTVNNITLTGGATGSNAVIGLQAGADTNAGITIDPNGSGNIQFFGAGDTGVFKMGNSAGFVKTLGFAACPAVANQSKAPLGVQTVVTGYLIVKDWLDQPHGVPAC